MSNENRRSRFDKFHKRISEAALGREEDGLKKSSLLPFAADFLDSLVTRMAAGDSAEAVFAWTVYRAWGNSKEHAIHIYSHGGAEPEETPLRQRDCALELAWLAAGHRAEWLDAPLQIFRDEAARRGVEPIDKGHICAAFTENRQRGTVASGTGYLLTPVPSPRVADSPEHLRTKGENPHRHQKFLEWAKVAHSSELQQLEVARSDVKRLTTFLLSSYKKWEKLGSPQTNGPPSLEALEALEASESEAVAPVPAPDVSREQSSGGRAFSGVVETPVVPPARPVEIPPARNPAPQPEAPAPPEWHAKLRGILKGLPIGVPLDEPMFRRIASHLSPELLDQYKTEAGNATNIRKWSGYADIARQVQERGVVPLRANAAAAGAPKRDAAIEQAYVDLDASRQQRAGKGVKP